MSGSRAVVVLAVSFDRRRRWPPRHGPAAAMTTTPATACGRPSRARASTSSWPTGSRTGRRPTTTAASPADRLVSGFDPTATRLLPRRRPEGPARPDRLHQGARHDGDLADAELQEQGGPARGRAVGRLPRLLDHGLHADRPAPRHQRRPARPGRRRARARDEGLLRHHHQPHRGRHRLRGRRAAGRTCRRTSSPTARRPARPFDDRDYAGGSSLPAARRRTVSFPYTPCSTPAEPKPRSRPG